MGQTDKNILNVMLIFKDINIILFPKKTGIPKYHNIRIDNIY